MSEPKNNLWQLPILKGVAGGAMFVIVTSLLISFVLPAWAVSFPIGPYVIDLGEIAPWIGIGVTLFIWYDAREAKKKASEAAALAGTAVTKIEAAAVQIDGLLAERDKAKVIEGEARGQQAGEHTARTLAQGQAEGREAERSSVAAKSETGTPRSTDVAVQAAAAAAAAIAAPAAAALAAPPAAAIAAPPAAEIAAPPVVEAVVPPAVEEAVKAAFDRERLKEKK